MHFIAYEISSFIRGRDCVISSLLHRQQFLSVNRVDNFSNRRTCVLPSPRYLSIKTSAEKLECCQEASSSCLLCLYANLRGSSTISLLAGSVCFQSILTLFAQPQWSSLVTAFNFHKELGFSGEGKYISSRNSVFFSPTAVDAQNLCTREAHVCYYWEIKPDSGVVSSVLLKCLILIRCESCKHFSLHVSAIELLNPT